MFFSGIVGYIDGCHIPIKVLSENPTSYINRKGFHSILMQAVCKNRARFMGYVSVTMTSALGTALHSFELTRPTMP